MHTGDLGVDRAAGQPDGPHSAMSGCYDGDDGAGAGAGLEVKPADGAFPWARGKILG